MPRLRGGAILLAAALAGVPVVAASEEMAPRAQLKAKRGVTLSAGISGVLVRLPPREGDRIAEGALVAAVDCSPHVAQRRVAEAKLQGAKAKLRVNERLGELNQGSVLETEVARAEAAMATAELASTDAILHRCEIRAPFAAVVVAVSAHQHQHVREGDSLVELVDPDSPEIEMVLPSKWLTWLKPGMVFTYHAEDLGRDYPARVDRVGGRVDPVSQTVRVLGKLDGKTPELLPGMGGKVRIERGAAQ